MSDWDHEKILRLINEYEGKPELWDCGQEDVYVSKWFAFASFAFLMNKNKVKETVNTETGSNIGNEIEAVSDGESEVDVSKEAESTNDVTADLEEELTLRQKTKETPTRKRKLFTSPRKQTLKKSVQQEDPRVAAAYDILKNVSNTPKDECFTFGQHIATKLQKFDNRVRSIAMHLMNNIIFDAEMGKYNDYQKTSVETHFQSRIPNIDASSPSLYAQESSSSSYVHMPSPSYSAQSYQYNQTETSETQTPLQDYLHTFDVNT
ncbi:uncharacterized protein LOC111691820 [Anoplophora glabripennis]|uniref:uncharacterized protein LOC111691820 n=1 Tax=Anoplophora glabripennis TaxID=217634 RepID=UPI000C767B6C|nr:uncharacterized protein LOC111691820 [Anoplophora glabripennis]